MSAQRRVQLVLPVGGLALVLLAALTIVGAGGASGASAPAPVVPVCPPTISFGETIECSLDVPGEVDAYTFTAAGGDVVLVRMGVATQGLDPEIRLLRPGTTDCEAVRDNGGVGSSAAEISSCALPTAGAYTIVASDLNGNDTGSYGLSLQLLNSPTGPLCTGLAFGQTTAPLPTLAVDGETDCYRFSGAAGDVVLVRMGVATQGLDPEIRLFGPDGGLVVNPDATDCEAVRDNGGVGSSAAEISSCALPTAGAYTIVASDLRGDEIGTYSVTLICLTPPCGTPGDVNCDGLVNVVDALFVLQYEVGLRAATDQCPLPTEPAPAPMGWLNVAICDVNDDGLCNVVDALFILQCEVGTPPGSEMPFCLAAPGVREETRLRGSVNRSSA